MPCTKRNGSYGKKMPKLKQKVSPRKKLAMAGIKKKSAKKKY